MAIKSSVTFSKNPFLSDINEKSFYSFSSLKQRLEMLKRLFGGNSRLILVVGERGSGKTLMMKQFLAVDEALWKSCRINAHNPLEENGDAKLAEMKQHRAYLYQGGEFPVVMMDDAHTLSYAELQFLIKMTGVKGYERQLDKLVLFCEPSLIKSVAGFSEDIPDEGVVEKIFMAALTRNESEEYLGRRMVAAGYTGQMPFSGSEVDTLYEISGGWPGVLNEEADRLLKKKMSESSKIPSLFRKMLSK